MGARLLKTGLKTCQNERNYRMGVKMSLQYSKPHPEWILLGSYVTLIKIETISADWAAAFFFIL